MAIILTAYPKSLEVTQGEHVIAGGIHANDVEFRFPEGDTTWEGMALIGCFESDLGQWCQLLDANHCCVLPWEVIAKGSEGSLLKIGLYGADETDANLIIRSTVWSTAPFRILPGPDATPSKEPTPSLYQQMLTAASKVADSATAVLKAADEVAAHKVYFDMVRAEITKNTQTTSANTALAVASADHAADSEEAAAASASAAAISAANALTSEGNAKTSETNAAASASAAASSASAAKTSETNAKTSETNAKTSETNAKSSETSASSSASSASTSASNAKTSETNAASSASAASTSATKAASSATSASTNATAASASATKAATSESNAKTSETNAAGSASAAKTSETNAKTSETNAASSASSAATSASNAKTSETNAASSATAALAAQAAAEKARDEATEIAGGDFATNAALEEVREAIPTAVSELDNDAGYSTEKSLRFAFALDYDTYTSLDALFAADPSGFEVETHVWSNGEYLGVKDPELDFDELLELAESVINNKGEMSAVLCSKNSSAGGCNFYDCLPLELTVREGNTHYEFKGYSREYDKIVHILCFIAMNTINGSFITPSVTYAKTEHTHTPSDIGAAPAYANGAGAHNAVYRGKNLGSAVTAAQWAAIKAGTFEDLFIGDYWTIGGVTYRIAAFDYYYRVGDTDCTTHHVTLVPDTNMYNHVMNDTGTTEGAYVNSKLRTEGLSQAKTTINSAFGEAHVLSHRVYLHNATTNGYASGAGWYDSTVEIMSEHNVYGGKIVGNQLNGTAQPTYYTSDKSQFPLFAFRPDMIVNRQTFWLRDVVNASWFASIHTQGIATCAGAHGSLGVRPAFSIYSA